ncbi:MAG: hypothetical protein J1E63_03650 [Muribaculaceae bacterium]|nr:hypothetical protein [Muribaculaceae bacterium]
MFKFFVTLSVFVIGLAAFSFEANAETMTDEIPSEYQSVLASFHESIKDGPIINSEFFLYDITGDDFPELWISVGPSEAETQLLAYTIVNGGPVKIFEGEGGDSDYFVYNDRLIGVMCNSGEGVVITYGYDGKTVTESPIQFSMWNEDGKPLSTPHDPVADEILLNWNNKLVNRIKSMRL